MRTIELDPFITKIFNRWRKREYPDLQSSDFSVYKEVKDGVEEYVFSIKDNINKLDGLTLESFIGTDNVRYVNSYTTVFK